MHYYKAIIQYDGTHYFGFQWQKGIPTIQAEINLVLSNFVNGKVTTMGASRTDAGVHAHEQIVKISAESVLDCEAFISVLNKNLPPQIRCLSLLPCEGSFKPTIAHRSKEYRYLFTNHLRSHHSEQRFIANNPFPLDIELMKQATLLIKGKHQFHNFCSTGSNVKSTEREIFLCDLSEVDPHSVLPQGDLFAIPLDLRSCYQLRIIGEGFLKQMVRHLMSALWLVGCHKITIEEFSQLLDGPVLLKRPWKVAAPRGLHLYKFHE